MQQRVRGRGNLGPLVISHLIESLVFVPIMVSVGIGGLGECRRALPPVPMSCDASAEPSCAIVVQLGVLFFLFEFFDGQLLAFLVLLCLWCAELFLVLG